MSDTRLTLEQYKVLYTESIERPEQFWKKLAGNLDWITPYKNVIEKNSDDLVAKWFPGGELNVAYNCIDRHVAAGFGEQVAYHFESNDGTRKDITYQTLQDEVCKLANALEKKGIKKGDRVCIYMPMVPEAVYAMLATVRIGAVHTVVFAGFSAEALKARVQDSGAKALITADSVKRGDKEIDLSQNVAAVLDDVSFVISLTDAEHDNEKVFRYSDVVEDEDVQHVPVPVASTDPMFILYTSGSTGKPKGVLHKTGGYLLYAATTHKYAFNLTEDDVYWCAADVGWITGHSYVVYGPLANRTTSVIYEGVPTYPDASRVWEVVDTYKVSIYYSTPTLLRSLMSFGDDPVLKCDRSSLRVLGTVGEPINPEVWEWYHRVVGNGACHITDTWWQTETGGHAILSLVRDEALKPGSAMWPFFGVMPELLNKKGDVIVGEGEGVLVLKGDWPGKLAGLYENETRFKETYLDPYPGYYFTGDGAKRDGNGHYWITGRVDDVLNVSGRLIGTAEVESVLVSHDSIAEAAVVDKPHDIKGSQVVAFVVPMKGIVVEDNLSGELQKLVKEKIGSFAKPDEVIFVDDLPKTRSGKIMRRVLRKMIVGEFDNLGDLSTLADPSVLDTLKKGMGV